MNQCIGRGRPGEGCGVTEEPSGATCSRCGGMVLSEAALLGVRWFRRGT